MIIQQLASVIESCQFAHDKIKLYLRTGVFKHRNSMTSTNDRWICAVWHHTPPK